MSTLNVVTHVLENKVQALNSALASSWVTVKLTRGTFDLFIKMKGTARQHYGDRYVIGSVWMNLKLSKTADAPFTFQFKIETRSLSKLGLCDLRTN